MAGSSLRSSYVLITGLYVTQFLGYGFFYTGLTAILRDRGASLATLGAVQAFGLIWSAKVLWAPVIDRWGSDRRGHYRSWILVLQPALVTAVVAMAPQGVLADTAVLVPLVGLVVLVSATQDIATDAIAVRLFRPADRGRVNGIQVASSYLGNVIGGGVVLAVYEFVGWTAAVLVLAAVAAVPLRTVWRFREPLGPPTPRTTLTSFTSLGSMFRSRSVSRWVLIVMPLYGIGLGIGYSLLTPMLVDAGWSLTRIGLVANVVGGVVAVTAGLVAGEVVARRSRRWSLTAFGFLRLVALVGLLPLTGGAAPLVGTTVAVCLLFTAHVAGSCAINTVAMDLARSTSAGTDYTMMASVAHLVSLGTGAVGVALAGAFGYTAILAVAIGLAAVGATCAAFLYRPPDRGPRAGGLGAAEQESHGNVL